MSGILEKSQREMIAVRLMGTSGLKMGTEREQVCVHS